MVKRLTLTEDMLKLISNIHYGEAIDLDDCENKQTVVYGIDFNSIYGGDSTFETIAYILGRYDEHIEGTETDPMGADFVDDFKNYMSDMHNYIVDHIADIEDLLHWFSNKGGLTPGTYKCGNACIWEKEN